MPSNVLMFEFLAVDHFGPVAEHVSKKLDGIGAKMGAVGKVAAFALGKVAVAGVAAFGYEMVRGTMAAANFQTLQLKTAAVIKSTGNAAHLSVAGLTENAKALEETSGVEEALILNSENVLATFRNIRNDTGKNNDIYNQATARILDLSVAMGEDLQTATVQVGKALNDPIRGMTALQRIGVTFNATQKEHIKHLVNSGHLMQAQKVILSELSKEFGGAAKAAGAGFGGAMARLKESLDNTFRDLATKLLPVLTSAANWLAAKLPIAIKATGRAFTVLGKFFADLYTKVGPGVIGFFRTLAPFVSGVARVLGGMLVSAISIIVHYFRDLLLPALREAGLKIFPQLKAAIATVGAAFRDHQEGIRQFGTVLMVVLKVAGIALALLALALVKVVIPALALLVIAILKAVGPIVRAFLVIGQVTSAVLTGIASFMIRVVRTIANVIGDIIGAFKNSGVWLYNAGAAIISGLVRGAVAFWPHLLIAIGHTIDFILGPFKPALIWLFGAGKWVITGLINGIRWMIGQAVQIISLVISNVKGPFRTALGWLLDVGKWVITGLINGIKSQIVPLVNLIKGAIVRLKGPFAGAAKFLWNFGWQLISGLYSGITTALASVRNWVNDHIVTPVINAVKWFFGISSPSKVMAGLGGHLITGLIQGIVKHNPVASITKIFGGMPQALGYVVHKGLLTLASLPGKALKALGGLGGSLLSKLGLSFGNPTDIKGFSGGVKRWAGFVNQALQMEGLSPSLLGKVLSQMQTESGGNPNAINLWDSNALAGTPSKGLLQVIDPTFRAFHWPGTSWNIYDPMANISAALNYARHRYGPNLSGLGQGHGYDSGGVAYGRGMFAKFTNDPERILSPRQTRWFERAMAQGGRGGTLSGGQVEAHFHFYNYVGDRQDLLRVLNQAARTGHLDAIVRLAR